MTGESKSQPPFVSTPIIRSETHASSRVTYPGKELREKAVQAAIGLVGVREQPPHSNSGPQVRVIQASTGAYGLPWCVSTVQAEDLAVLGSTYAQRTANAYSYAQYAKEHGDTIAKPIRGCVVVYRIGAGHCGRVITVNKDGTFDAVEGNAGDAVRIVRRDPRHLECVFVLRKEYR